MSAGRHIKPSREMITHDRPATLTGPLILPALDESMVMAGSGEDLSLAAYWYVLAKRRWTIFAVALALTAVVAIVSFRMTPIYKATARVEIEPEAPQLQSGNDIYQRVDADDVFLQTQIQVLKSENLAWQTIEQLGLAKELGVLSPEALSKEQMEQEKVQLIDVFEDKLKVELVPRTRMLSVGFESPDPQRAAQIATTLVDNYLDYNFRQKYEAIHRSGWMEHQLSELKGKVEKSQQELVTYEQKNQIVNTGGKQDVLEQMLADLSRDLTSAKSERIQKESVYLQVLANRSELASLVHDDLLQKLEEELADLKQQHTEAVAQYGPKFPKAQRVQLQINEAQAQIEREQSRIMDRIHNDYNAAAQREKLANATVARQKEDVGRLNQLLVQDNILRHEFDTNQQLYQSIMQRVKDATVSAGLRSTNIHLVDSASAPTLPVRPKRLLNVAIALWAGVILGVMAAFAQDRLDPSVKTAEEAEALIVTPALAAIPLEGGSWFRPKALSKTRHRHQLALTLTKRPHCSLSEAFRVLGTAVSGTSNPPTTLLITSAQTGEGKTFTALNLAQALAQRTGPILIMDCDLRRSGIAEALGIRNDKGVSTVLSGEHDVSEVVQQYVPVPNLWVLPSGIIPSNPAELLASPRMTALLETLSAQFVCVIIDSPPVLAVTDATILSTLVDGVLLVAASGSTPRGGLVRTRRILGNAGARIMGIAVNKLDPDRQGHGDPAYRYAVHR
jgi:succinoglycan biosynthesis transport protein ExoP